MLKYAQEFEKMVLYSIITRPEMSKQDLNTVGVFS